MKILPHHRHIHTTLLSVVMLLTLSVVTFSFHQTQQLLIPKKTIKIPDDVVIPAETMLEQTIEHEPLQVVFGGDVMLARYVQVMQESRGSYMAAWDYVADVFNVADIAVVNLESPFSETGPYPTEGFVFKSKPENIEGLLSAGIDVVTLANNHFTNAGFEGMEYTLTYLEQNAIVAVGAGRNKSEAYAAKTVSVGDTDIAFVAQVYPVGMTATDDVVGLATYDLDELRKAITEARLTADYVVALFHGGIEYVAYPNQQQIDFAHTAIDAGADVVIGHHPHWVQETEMYKDKMIFYSLGNLIFDQNWSTETSRGMVVTMFIGDTIWYETSTIIIEENFQPHFTD